MCNAPQSESFLLLSAKRSYNTPKMAIDVPKQLIIAAAAFTFTVFQLSASRGSDPTVPVGSTSPYALFTSSSSDGFGSDEAAQDWLLIRSMLKTRFGKFSDMVEILDARADGGTGARQLMVYARPGAVIRCAASPASSGSYDYFALGLGNDTEGPELRLYDAPMLLLTAFEPEVSRGVNGYGPVGGTGPRQFFNAAHRKARPPSPPPAPLPEDRPRHPPQLAHPHRPTSLWRRAMSALDRSAGGSSMDHVPAVASRTSSRGKAARAFGASQRGPSLAKRERSEGAPALTLRVHVHVEGITCCNASELEAGVMGSSGLSPACALGAVASFCHVDAVPVLKPPVPVEMFLGVQASGAALASGAAAGRDASWIAGLVGACQDARRLRLASVLDAVGLPLGAQETALQKSSSASAHVLAGRDGTPATVSNAGERATMPHVDGRANDQPASEVTSKRNSAVADHRDL